MSFGTHIFCNVREDNIAGIELSKEMGSPITGLIGTFFMAEQAWIIDFMRQEIVIPVMDTNKFDNEAIKMNEV